MWFDKMKDYFDDKDIEGRNLDNVKARFGNLSDALPERYEGCAESVNNFQKRIVSILEGSKDMDINPMKIEDDKVVVEEGVLYHVCPPKMSSLEGISLGGLLCSEWFGVLENEGEARFCAFLSEKNDKFDKNESKNVVLYFDSDNPLMKTLAQNDYFEYIKRKREIRKNLFDRLSGEEKEAFLKEAEILYRKEYSGRTVWKLLDEKGREAKVERAKADFHNLYSELLPDSLNDKIRTILKEKYGYSDTILDLFEEVVEPLSQGGKNFHDNENRQTYYWRAIPGGVPSSLINGIQINREAKKNLSSKDIEKIQKLFPKAVIFDENRMIIARPLKKSGR